MIDFILISMTIVSVLLISVPVTGFIFCWSYDYKDLFLIAPAFIR
jgi:hypothetical protein